MPGSAAAKRSLISPACELWRCSYDAFVKRIESLCGKRVAWQLQMVTPPLLDTLIVDCADGRQNASCGGEGGIRTPDTRQGMSAFEADRFNHSRTSPRHIELRDFNQRTP